MSDGMNVGQLNVKVSLDTSDIDKEIEDLTKQVNKAEKELQRLTKKDAGTGDLASQIRDAADIFEVATATLGSAMRRRVEIVKKGSAQTANIVKNENEDLEDASKSTGKTLVQNAKDTASGQVGAAETGSTGVRTVAKRTRKALTANATQQRKEQVAAAAETADATIGIVKEAAEEQESIIDRSQKTVIRNTERYKKEFQRALTIFTGGEVKGKIGSGVQRILSEETEALQKAAEELKRSVATIEADPVEPKIEVEVDKNLGTEIGSDIMKNVAKGINATKGEVLEAIMQAMREVIQAGRDAVRAKSPSQDGYDLGHDIITGIANGIRTGEIQISESLREALINPLNKLGEQDVKDFNKILVQQLRSIATSTFLTKDAFSTFSEQTPLSSIFGDNWEANLENDTDNFVNQLTQALKQINSLKFEKNQAFQEDPFKAFTFYDQLAVRLAQLKELIPSLMDRKNLAPETRGQIETFKSLVDSKIIDKSKRSFLSYAGSALDAIASSEQLTAAIANQVEAMRKAVNANEQLAAAENEANQIKQRRKRRQSKPKPPKIDIVAEAEDIFNTASNYEEATSRLHQLMRKTALKGTSRKELIEASTALGGDLESADFKGTLEERLALVKALNKSLTLGKIPKSVGIGLAIKQMLADLVTAKSNATKAKSEIVTISNQMKSMMDVVNERFLSATVDTPEGRRYGGNVLSRETFDAFSESFYQAVMLFKNKLSEITANRDVLNAIGAQIDDETARAISDAEEIRDKLNSSLQLLEKLEFRKSPRKKDPLISQEPPKRRNLTAAEKENLAPTSMEDIFNKLQADIEAIKEASRKIQKAAPAVKAAIVENKTLTDDSTTSSNQHADALADETNRLNSQTTALNENTSARRRNTGARAPRAARRATTGTVVGTVDVVDVGVSEVSLENLEQLKIEIDKISEAVKELGGKFESLSEAIVQAIGKSTTAVQSLIRYVESAGTAAISAMTPIGNLATAIAVFDTNVRAAKVGLDELTKAEKDLNDELAREVLAKAAERSGKVSRKKKAIEELSESASVESSKDNQAAAAIDTLAAASENAQVEIADLRAEYEKLIQTISGEAVEAVKNFETELVKSSGPGPAGFRFGARLNTAVTSVLSANLEDYGPKGLKVAIKDANELLNLISLYADYTDRLIKTDEAARQQFDEQFSVRFKQNLDHAAAMARAKLLEAQSLLSKEVTGTDFIAEERARAAEMLKMLQKYPKIQIPKEADIQASTAALEANEKAIDSNIAKRLEFNEKVAATSSNFFILNSAIKANKDTLTELTSSLVAAKADLAKLLNKRGDLVELDLKDAAPALKNFAADMKAVIGDLNKVKETIESYDALLANFLKTMSGTSRIVKSFIKASADNANPLADAMNQLAEITKAFPNVDNLAGGVEKIVNSLTSIQVKDADVRRSVSAFGTLAKALKDIGDPTAAANTATSSTADRMERNATATEAAAVAMERLGTFLGPVSRNFISLNGNMTTFNSGISEFKRRFSFKEQAPKFKEFNKFITDLKAAFKDFPKSFEKTPEVVTALVAAVANLELDSKTRQLEALALALRAVADSASALKGINSGSGLNIKIGNIASTDIKDVPNVASGAGQGPVIVINEGTSRRRPRTAAQEKAEAAAQAAAEKAAAEAEVAAAAEALEKKRAAYNQALQFTTMGELSSVVDFSKQFRLISANLSIFKNEFAQLGITSELFDIFAPANMVFPDVERQLEDLKFKLQTIMYKFSNDLLEGIPIENNLRSAVNSVLEKVESIDLSKVNFELLDKYYTDNAEILESKINQSLQMAQSSRSPQTLVENQRFKEMRELEESRKRRIDAFLKAEEEIERRRVEEEERIKKAEEEKQARIRQAQEAEEARIQKAQQEEEELIKRAQEQALKQIKLQDAIAAEKKRIRDQREAEERKLKDEENARLAELKAQEDAIRAQAEAEAEALRLKTEAEEAERKAREDAQAEALRLQAEAEAEALRKRDEMFKAQSRLYQIPAGVISPEFSQIQSDVYDGEPIVTNAIKPDMLDPKLVKVRDAVDDAVNKLFEEKFIGSNYPEGLENLKDEFRAKYATTYDKLELFKALDIDVTQALYQAMVSGMGSSGGSGSPPTGTLPDLADYDDDDRFKPFSQLESSLSVLDRILNRAHNASDSLFNTLRKNPDVIKKMDEAGVKLAISTLLKYSKYFEQLGNFPAALDRVKSAAQIAFTEYGKADPRTADIFRTASVLKGVVRKASLQSPTLDVSKDQRETAASVINSAIRSVKRARADDTGLAYRLAINSETGSVFRKRIDTTLISKYRELNEILTSTDDKFVRLRHNAPVDTLEKLKNQVSELRRELLAADLKRLQMIYDTEPNPVVKAGDYEKEMKDLGIYETLPGSLDAATVELMLKKFEQLKFIKTGLSEAARIDKSTLGGYKMYAAKIENIYQSLTMLSNEIKDMGTSGLAILDPAMVDQVTKLYNSSIRQLQAKSRTAMSTEFRNMVNDVYNDPNLDLNQKVAKLQEIQSKLQGFNEWEFTALASIPEEFERMRRLLDTKLTQKLLPQLEAEKFKSTIASIKDEFEDIADVNVMSAGFLDTQTFGEQVEKFRTLIDRVKAQADAIRVIESVGKDGNPIYKPLTTDEQSKQNQLYELRANLAKKEREYVVSIGLAEMERLRNANELNKAKKLGEALQARENKMASTFGMEPKLMNQIQQRIRSINQTRTWFGRFGGAGGGLDLKELTASIAGASVGAYSFADLIENAIFSFKEFIRTSVVMRNEFDKVTSSLFIVSKTAQVYSSVMEIARENQRLFGGTLTENAREMSGFTLVARTANVGVEELNSVAQRLALFDPGQGITGASTALREFLAGNIRSLRERFELPSNVLAQLGDRSLTASEKIETLSKFLDQQGLSAQNLKAQLNLASQAYADFAIQWEETSLNIGNFIQEAFAPAVRGINRFLGIINNDVAQVAESLALETAVQTGQFVDLTDPEVSEMFAKRAGTQVAQEYSNSFIKELRSNANKTNAAILGTLLTGSFGILGGVIGTAGGPVGTVAGGTVGASLGAALGAGFYNMGAYNDELAPEVTKFLDDPKLKTDIFKALEVSPEFKAKLDLIKEQFLTMVPVSSVEDQLEFLNIVLKTNVDQILNESGRIAFANDIIAPNIIRMTANRSTPGTELYIEGLDKRRAAIEQIANSSMPQYIESLNNLFIAHAKGAITDEQFLITQDAISSTLQNSEIGFESLVESRIRDEIESRKASATYELVVEALNAAADSAGTTAAEFERLRMFFPEMSETGIANLIKEWKALGNASTNFYKTETAALDAEIALIEFKRAMDATMTTAGPTAAQVGVISSAISSLEIDLNTAAEAWRRYRVSQLIGASATIEIDVAAQEKGLVQGTQAYKDFVHAQQAAAMQQADNQYVFEKTATAQQRANAAIEELAKADPGTPQYSEALRKMTDANTDWLNERNSGTSGSNNEFQDMMDQYHKDVADAEQAHKDNLLKIEEDFIKKKKELERESFVTKEQGRYDFYADNVVGSKLPADMVEGFKAEYETIWATARQFEQAGEFEKAAEYEKLAIENLERKIQYATDLNEAQSDYDQAVAEGDSEAAAEAQTRLNNLAALKPLHDRVIDSNQSFIDTLTDPGVEQYNEDIAEENDNYAQTLKDLAEGLKEAIEAQTAAGGSAGVTAEALNNLNQKGIESADAMREAAKATAAFALEQQKLRDKIATAPQTPDGGVDDSAAVGVKPDYTLFVPNSAIVTSAEAAAALFYDSVETEFVKVDVGSLVVGRISASLYNALTPEVRRDIISKLSILNSPAEVGKLTSEYALAGNGAAAEFVTAILAKMTSGSGDVKNRAELTGSETGAAFVNGVDTTDLSPLADALDFTDSQKNEIIVAYDVFGNEIGLSYMNGILKGIEEVFPEVINKARESARSMVDASKKELEMRSPSKVAASEIGIPFVQGIVRGIEKASSGLTSTVATVARAAVETARASINTLPAGIKKSEENINAFKQFSNVNISILEGLRSLLPDLKGAAQGKATYAAEIAKIDQDTEAQIIARREKLSQDLLLARTEDERRIIKAIADQDIALLQQQANIQKASQEDQLRNTVDQEALNAKLSSIQQNAANQLKALQERMAELAKTNPEEAARRYEIQSQKILEIANLRQEIEKYMADNNLTTADAYVNLIQQQIEQIKKQAQLEISGTGSSDRLINSVVYNINMDLTGSNLRREDVQKIVQRELTKAVSASRGATS